MIHSRLILGSSLSCLLWFCTAPTAQAQFNVFFGPANGDWFAEENWSPFGLPVDGGTAIIDQNQSAVVQATGAVAGTVYVGTEMGPGQLTVKNGGTGISSGLGIEAGSSFSVMGATSTWTVNGSFFAQNAGATATVSAGGKLTSALSGFSSPNDYFDYGAHVTVTGTGSSWTSRNFVGLYTGTFDFLDHAVITTGRLDMSPSQDNVSVVNVSGGAQWTANSLLVGNDVPGSAVINLSDGAALITTRSQTNATRIYESGRINIGIGGLAGTLTTAGVVFSPVGGTLAFNHTDDVVFNSPISGNGTVIKDGSGTTTLGGLLTYTGPTVVTEGTLHVTGTGGSSAITIEAGARFSGNGTAGSLTLSLGARLTPGASFAPGGSFGLLTIGSGSELGGDLSLELGGLLRGSQYDALNISGDGFLTLGGDLNITFLNAFMPAPGNSFQVFNAAGFDGDFEHVNLPALTSGSWDTSQLRTTGVLAVVPEPTTTALLAAGLLWPMLRRRRK